MKICRNYFILFKKILLSLLFGVFCGALETYKLCCYRKQGKNVHKWIYTFPGFSSFFRRGETEVQPITTRLMSAEHSLGLGNAGTPKPEAHLPTWNCSDQPTPGPGPLLQILLVSFYCWAYSPMERIHQRSLQKEKATLCKSGNLSRESGLGRKGAPHGGGLQRLCGQFCHEDSDVDGK